MNRSSGCEDISMGKHYHGRPAAHFLFCLLFYERIRSLARCDRSLIIIPNIYFEFSSFVEKGHSNCTYVIANKMFPLEDN